MEEVKKGSGGFAVTVLQYVLEIPVSSVFDDNTDKTVRAFQTEHELKSDGVAGAKTWGRIAEILPTAQRQAIPKVDSRVKAIQMIVGLPAAEVDGKFGKDTEAAVKAYQTAHGLKPDGVVATITWAFMLTGVMLTKAVAIKPPDFKQFDKRWNKVMYSRSNPARTIGNNGCGPTSMTDIIAAWWDPAALPPAIAKMFVQNGWCAESSGTYRAAFAEVAKKYGASKFIRTGDIATVKKSLLEGAYVVALMGPGYFTGGGHYIVLWRYTPATDIIDVCNCGSSTKNKATAKLIGEQRKEFFIFYR